MKSARANARQLRYKMTDAERRVWYFLRAHRFFGLKFRRQHPIGPYIVDFACLARGLVIEIDGGQHMERAAGDVRRDEFLKSEGLRVLRFWNHDVLSRTPLVMEEILRALAADPALASDSGKIRRAPSPPAPLPQSGRGES
jgi:very-short-patch-repair endonuclease